MIRSWQRPRARWHSIPEGPACRDSETRVDRKGIGDRRGGDGATLHIEGGHIPSGLDQCRAAAGAALTR
jgi:hypothetical protein